MIQEINLALMAAFRVSPPKAFDFSQPNIVQAFYQEYLVNLTLIATKANSTDFVSLLWPKC